MPTGTVKRWNDERGFGFISPDDGGEDIFVHRSALGGGAEYLEENSQVDFESRWDDRKQKMAAASCTPLGGGGGGGGGGGYGKSCGGGGGGKGYGKSFDGGKGYGKRDGPYGGGKSYGKGW